MNADGADQSGDADWRPGEWQPRQWSAANEGSSLTDSSLDDSRAYSRQDNDQGDSDNPSPFSREGSSPGDALGSAPSAQPPAAPDASRSDGPAAPAGSAESRIGSSYQSAAFHGSAGSQASAPPYPPPADPGQPQPLYQAGPEPAQPYGQQSLPPHGSNAPPAYGAGGIPAPANAPDGTPYGVNPYDTGAYPYNQVGGYDYSPSGMAQQHPQATTALILGIAGVVLCPPVGIAGLAIGSKARKEIDADPGRYRGRGQATAGFVLGIISLITTLFWVIVIVISVAVPS